MMDEFHSLWMKNERKFMYDDVGDGDIDINDKKSFLKNCSQMNVIIYFQILVSTLFKLESI